MERIIKYHQAINEAIDICLAEDSSVFTIGLGVPDPKGVFGTTLGLIDKYGSGRVMDMPTSENALTGFAIGAAISGLRPIMSHQRVDFALPSMEQIINQAANWQYMFGGLMSVPLVIRMVIGRGWGQGPQHSQSLQALFTHIPGLKVVMPATPYDAKGLLIDSVRDNNPVIFLEHRWLHNMTGNVPEGAYTTKIGQPKTIREGKDITIVALSYMTIEAIKAAEVLEENGISVEIIDLRSLKPLDYNPIFDSVKKTGRLIVADTGWKTCGFGAEVIARVTESVFENLSKPPTRIALPDVPSPTTRALSKHFYKTSNHIIVAAQQACNKNVEGAVLKLAGDINYDVPDASFTGPF